MEKIDDITTMSPHGRYYSLRTNTEQGSWNLTTSVQKCPVGRFQMLWYGCIDLLQFSLKNNKSPLIPEDFIF